MQNTEDQKSTPPENEGLTENKKSTPPVKKRGKGRPAKPEAEESRLFIRGVSTETKTAIKKAAKKLNRTQGEFFNMEVREYCQGIIQNKAKPPAAPEDIKNMATAELMNFKAELVADIVKELRPEQKTFLQKLADLLK